ncbi:MAG: alcohol dehydrogenase catalytic domain-containing protein [Hespellia sp.]|nr:alcohol dehydrogenase catalytic domain-containing protein [Hespellia sp.]
MRGIKIVAPRKVEVQEWEDVKVEPHEVRVRIKASALCRSDLSLYYMDQMAPTVGAKAAGSVIPGHEPAGVIEEVGSAVTGLKIGDRVAINCFDGCGHCRFCRAGFPQHCETRFVCLGFDRHGGDADTLVTPASTCLPIPDDMSFKTACISTDVIGNLYNTMKTIGVNGNKRVAVIGVGPMGLGGVLAAKAMGAEVIAVDTVQNRLDSAQSLGADHAFMSDQAAKYVKELTKGKGLDCVVDCSGNPNGVNLGFEMLGKFGKFGQIGGGNNATISLGAFVDKVATYVGSWYFGMGEWDEIVDLIMNKIGNDVAERLVSHEFPLENPAVQEAWELFDHHQTDKVIFIP